MSLPASIRAAAITVAIGVAVIAMPAFATDATVVTFQAGNPWAQEVGTVTHDDAAHDYSVAVDANKTFQIKLFTPNPNLFFKVTGGNGKTLVDTSTSGDHDWSTLTTAASTYTIRVYIQPETIQRGDTTKYALNIGQYGQADMQAASTSVAFEAGKPWAQAVGTLDATGNAHDYTATIPAGESFAVNLVTRDANVHFKVLDKTAGKTLVDSAQTGSAQWSTVATAPTDFVVHVFADASALPPGAKLGYTVQIGHYAQASAPASAGSAAAPAAASAPASSTAH